MKSLAEREAYRAKQRAAEGVAKGTSPKSEGKAEEAFDAKDWLNDSVENVNGNLSELSNDELSAVEKAEASGKKRNSVTEAIKKEKDKRTNAGVDWTPNNA